jgi:ubiquinone/menaquinone biosynthesis C-methylase UbiE
VWAKSEYLSSSSPGWRALKNHPVEMWLEKFRVRSFLDAGCGAGKVIRKLRNAHPEIKFHGIDIGSQAALKKEVRDCFTQGTLWDASVYPQKFDMIFCVDVMEHIPEQYIDKTLSNFSRFAEKIVFLIICLVPDVFGKPLVGEDLHCTVKDIYWWFNKFEKHGFRVLSSIGLPEYLTVLLLPE